MNILEKILGAVIDVIRGGKLVRVVAAMVWRSEVEGSTAVGGVKGK